MIINGWISYELQVHISHLTKFGNIAKNRLVNWPSGIPVLGKKAEKGTVIRKEFITWTRAVDTRSLILALGALRSALGVFYIMP